MDPLPNECRKQKLACIAERVPETKVILHTYHILYWKLLTVSPFIGIVAPVVFNDTSYGGVAQLVEQTAHIRSVRGPSPFAAIERFSFPRLNRYGVREAFLFSGDPLDSLSDYPVPSLGLRHIQEFIRFFNEVFNILIQIAGDSSADGDAH